MLEKAAKKQKDAAKAEKAKLGVKANEAAEAAKQPEESTAEGSNRALLMDAEVTRTRSGPRLLSPSS